MTKTAKQFAITTTFSLVVLIALVFLGYELQSRATALQDALQAIANETAVEQAFSAVSTILDSTEAERTQVAGYIIDGQSGSIDFLNSFELIAQNQGVMLANAQLETLVDSAVKTNVIKLTYDVTGTANAVDSFITSVESLPFASYISEYSRSERRVEGGATEVVGRFVLHVAATNIEI